VTDFLFQLHSPRLVGQPHLFEGLNWQFKKGQFWAVYGDSGSGKTILKDTLSGTFAIAPDPSEPSIINPYSSAEMSPQLERELLEREKREDDSEFIDGGYDCGRSAQDIITEVNPNALQHFKRWIEFFSVSNILSTSFKSLSNGETRKILFLRALVQNADLMLLDSPFEGLDQKTRDHFTQALEHREISNAMILFTQKWQDIPKTIDGLIWLKKNKPASILTYREAKARNLLEQQTQTLILPDEFRSESKKSHSNPMIFFDKVSIKYCDKVIFSNFSWEMNYGERWLFSGPNGAGKTTLLQLINADHPQAYGQSLQLFGYQRGQGESIWDIKSHIGFVSADLQRNFPLSMTGTAMVVSGFHDSMGVYKKPSSSEIEQAQLWLQCLNIEPLGKQFLSHLSWGEIRCLMIARALVKKPELLILDEPCQGLDDTQSKSLLQLVENCCERFNLSLILVSHDTQENLTSLTHQLRWVQTESGHYQHCIQKFKISKDN